MIIPEMQKEIYKEELERQNKKMSKKLSLLQKLELNRLERKIMDSMKEGKNWIYIYSISPRVAKELIDRGFFIGEQNCVMGGSMLCIVWKKKKSKKKKK